MFTYFASNFAVYKVPLVCRIIHISTYHPHIMANSPSQTCKCPIIHNFEVSLDKFLLGNVRANASNKIRYYQQKVFGKAQIGKTVCEAIPWW